MKNKGMIAALGLILVLGIVTTAATRCYIREQAGSERSLTVGPEAMYEADAPEQIKAYVKNMCEAVHRG